MTKNLPDRCPVCDSDNISFHEGDGPTGVVAPDGGQEYRRECWIECHHCGAKEEV